jgi:D-glycero-D-manno-heptose 1,7-bisphosphate phosphatase
MKKFIILDRDGVINHDSDEYIKSPQEWKPIKGSLEAIASLNHAGFRVAVATNQSGVARKLFNMDTLVDIHNKMHKLVGEVGGHIDAIAFCPHAPRDDCDCRKPKPGMLIDLAKRFNADLSDLYIIGDSLRDLQAAAAVNAKPILVRTGKGEHVVSILEESGLGNVPVFDDLAAATDYLVDANN